MATFLNIYISGKVCGLLTILLGTQQGPDSTDYLIRVLTGPCQELECEDYIEASQQSYSVPARFLLGFCQDCQEALEGSRRLQKALRGFRSSKVLAREQFANVKGLYIKISLIFLNLGLIYIYFFYSFSIFLIFTSYLYTRR